MSDSSSIVVIIVSICAGIGIALLPSSMWIVSLREKLRFLIQEKERTFEENIKLQEEISLLEKALKSTEMELVEASKERELLYQSQKNLEEVLAQTKEQLVEKMKILSQEALHSSQSHFLSMAKAHFEESQKRFHSDCALRDEKMGGIINPLKSALDAMDKKVSEIEMARKEAFGGLIENINKLSQETSFLSKALRHPSERGKWGEVQLKRLVEMAGLIERCHFTVQETSEDGLLRADMVITLPNERKIIIDAKVPLEAYIKSLEAPTKEVQDREALVHADQLEKHVKALADKKYWEKYKGAIDFIVLFLPSEALLLTALSKRSDLVERSLDKNVLIATPSTLMALLHAVHQGWREARVERDIKDILMLAKEWFDRCSVFVKHLQATGKSLETTVLNYNKSINSFESRFLVTLRKLAKDQQLASGQTFDELEPLSIPIAQVNEASDELDCLPELQAK